VKRESAGVEKNDEVERQVCEEEGLRTTREREYRDGLTEQLFEQTERKW